MGKAGCRLIFKPKSPLGHTFPLVCLWRFSGFLGSCQNKDMCLTLGSGTWVCTLVFALLVDWLLVLCLADQKTLKRGQALRLARQAAVPAASSAFLGHPAWQGEQEGTLIPRECFPSQLFSLNVVLPCPARLPCVGLLG